MLPIESSTLLRIAIFSGFVGFVLFCGSYAVQVWLKRNKGNRPSASRATWIGAALVLFGLLGAGASWALNRFVDRSGVVDGSALFVVHARRDGNVRMTTSHDVGVRDVIAEFQPPATGAQLEVIDSQIGEAQARIAALRVRPLELDPVLLQRQEQARIGIAQQRQFEIDFARAHRELLKTRADAVARAETEHSQIANELAEARAAWQGLQPQRKLAAEQLARSVQLRKSGLTTVQMFEERSAAVLALNVMGRRLETTIGGLAARLALLREQEARAALVFAELLDIAQQNIAATANSLDELHRAYGELARQIGQDRLRASALQAHELDVAQRRVQTLNAERGRAVASQQVVAPFAGRVVYRHPSPGLAPDGAVVLAVSAGAGFAASIGMPASEIDDVAAAGTVMFALDHPVLKKYFPGVFRSADSTSVEPGRSVATFDAQLAQDAIGLLGLGREPVKVRLLWQPVLLETGYFRASLFVLVLGILLMTLDKLGGSLRLPTRRLAAHRGGHGAAVLGKPDDGGLHTAFADQREGKA